MLCERRRPTQFAHKAIATAKARGRLQPSADMNQEFASVLIANNVEKSCVSEMVSTTSAGSRGKSVSTVVDAVDAMEAAAN